MNVSNRSFTLLILLGLIGATCALSIYAYLGIFTRYMADDYCLLVSLYSADVLTASWNKYLFTSNRFSNLFIIGLWELFPNSIAFVPALHIVLWVVSLTWLFYEISCFFKLKKMFLLQLLLSELIILFTFYTSPNIFQVLYWRPGQVTYLTPLVLFSFASAWLIKLVNSHTKVNLKLYIPFFVLISFFIGGLSETINTFHLALLSLVAVAVFVLETSQRRKIALALLLSLFAGTFSALLAMFFAPANALRINPENSSPNLFEVISRSWEYTYAFLLGAFKALPTPYLAFIAITLSLTYLFFLTNQTAKWNLQFAWAFLFVPILTYLLIFVTFAPSAYGQSYPVERVRFAGHFILVCSVISLSVYFGYYLSSLKISTLKFTNTIALLLAITALLYPFWMIRQPLQTYEFRRLWAKRWDERQTMIYTAIQKGETNMFIPALDGYKSTKELDAFSTFWANQCAAQYYGVKSITAFSVEEENVLDFFSE
jgi:hypothetical protein